MKDTPPHQRAALSDGGKSWVVPPKNSADIKMVVDAMELAYTNDNIDTYVLASGDSDFTPILSKLRELGKHTIVISLPDRLSWRLEEYSDETLSLTELFRNRTIDEREYERALTGIYAAYELGGTSTGDERSLPCRRGGPRYLSVQLVRQSMQFLNGGGVWEGGSRDGKGGKDGGKDGGKGGGGSSEYQQHGEHGEKDDTSDLEWILNTKDASKHMEIIRGPQGKHYVRPLRPDPNYGKPGPSRINGALSRKHRRFILEHQLHRRDLMPKALRHESAAVMLEQVRMSLYFCLFVLFVCLTRHFFYLLTLLFFLS